ncbi:hypothetical protein [Mycobacterium sp. URHB0021]
MSEPPTRAGSVISRSPAGAANTPVSGWATPDVLGGDTAVEVGNGVSRDWTAPGACALLPTGCAIGTSVAWAMVAGGAASGWA